MNLNNRKSFLELKVIWRDDDMFELKVTASNGRYFGTTEVYDTKEKLANFAFLLKGYLVNPIILFHEAGEKDSYAYFAMKFYSIGNSGHIGVQILLEENVATEYRPEEKDKLSLEILVDLNSIDNFQKELWVLATNEEGIATLYGQENR
jgi:hypothetical protein